MLLFSGGSAPVHLTKLVGGAVKMRVAQTAIAMTKQYIVKHVYCRETHFARWRQTLLLTSRSVSYLPGAASCPLTVKRQRLL